MALSLISFAASRIGALGQISLLCALALSVAGLLLGAIGGLKRDPRATESARRLVWGVFGFVSLATLLLIAALLQDDFSVRYVAEHSMRASPTWVKVTSLWGALEGSILLWTWLLSAYALLLSLSLRRDALRPWALAATFFSLVFFTGVVSGVSSPFTPLSVIPADGRGPNPALQNHWMMAVHPVLLYLGFVGLSVPFAYAVAALITGRLSERWLSVTRRWTLIAWIFLSAAIVAGGWWSYETLGWGGYWAWDPVENASFIPWLLTTAFLHSIQIQERRGLLRGWNIWLIVLAYSSTVLGTFLNRSGIVQSVHAFAGGAVGPVFLGFLAALLFGGVVLASWRAPKLRDLSGPPAPLSREGAFLAGNWLFLVFSVMVLLGTLFPVLMEAATGRKSSVGAPFYNTFAVPLGLGILFLMGLGPLLPWRRASGEGLRYALRWPLGAGLLATLIAAAAGVRSAATLLTMGLSLYNLAGLAQLTARAAKQRGSLSAALREQPRRYGAYLAHCGLVLVALGLAFSGAYKNSAEITLNKGQDVALLKETLRFESLSSQTYPYGSSTVARISIDGLTYAPRTNLYNQAPETAYPTPAVRYGFFGDTYLVATAFDPQGQWVSVRLIESPLVSWIWVGTLVVVLGAGITLLPPRRLQPVPAPVSPTALAAD